MVQAFKTYVRPLLESAVPVWNPIKKADINRIESVQRRFTKMVYYRCSIPYQPYEERLTNLKLSTLEDRRIYFDISTAHSYFHSQIPPLKALIRMQNSNRDLRPRLRQLTEPHAKGPRKQFFSNRVAPNTNSIECKSFDLVPKKFKIALKKQLNLL